MGSSWLDQFSQSLQHFLARYEPIDELLLQRMWLEENNATPELLAKFDKDFGDDIKAVRQPAPFKWYEYIFLIIRIFHIPFTHVFYIVFFAIFFNTINSLLTESLKRPPTDDEAFIFLFQLATMLLGFYYTFLDFDERGLSANNILSKITPLSILYLVLMTFIYQDHPTFPALDGTDRVQSLFINMSVTIIFIYIVAAMAIFTRWITSKFGLSFSAEPKNMLKDAANNQKRGL